MSYEKWTVLPGMLLLAAMAVAQAQRRPYQPAPRLMVKLETTLATFSNKAGDPFQGN
jgi:hypothetical protein